MAHHLEAVMSTSTIERGQLSGLYSPPRTPVIVDVPTLVYLCIDGRGDPATTLAWAEAVDALTAVSAAVRTLTDQPVGNHVTAGSPVSVGMPLEILWPSDGADDGWTVLMTQPHATTPDLVRRAIEITQSTAQLESAALVRRRRIHEGWAAQLMHIGPRPVKPDAFERLAAFADRHGYHPHGLRHEIRLSGADPLAPGRTIYRQPVAPFG